MAVRLFVYGSLKRGGRHHDELRGARFLGVATTAQGYRVELVGEYLALVELEPGDKTADESAGPSSVRHAGRALGADVPLESPSSDSDSDSDRESAVQGELFEVPEELLPLLDEFEGDAYLRGHVRLAHAAGGMALAYFKKAR